MNRVFFRCGLAASAWARAPSFWPLSNPANRCWSSSFRYDDLTVTNAEDSKLATLDEDLQFGTHFADHMLETEWSHKDGWTAPKIVPFHNLVVHPAAKIFHYAPQCFEGMKACKGEDGKVRLFRPQLHIERLLRSAERAALPTFDKNELLKCVIHLLKVDKAWVPSDPKSLYLRPTLIGTDPSIGVKKSQYCLLYVITSPVGKYHSKHLSGSPYLSLLVDPELHRVCKGGFGQVKLGCNYATTLYHQQFAHAKMCDDILFVTGEDQKLTELMSTNVFIVLADGEKRELVTPPENDMILPGITRRSLIEIAAEWKDVKTTERHITMAELVDAYKTGRLVEMFGSGTAAVVSQVDRILYVNDGQTQEIKLKVDEVSSLANRFRKVIREVKIGKRNPHWSIIID